MANDHTYCISSLPDYCIKLTKQLSALEGKILEQTEEISELRLKNSRYQRREEAKNKSGAIKGSYIQGVKVFKCHAQAALAKRTLVNRSKEIYKFSTEAQGFTDETTEPLFHQLTNIYFPDKIHFDASETYEMQKILGVNDSKMDKFRKFAHSRYKWITFANERSCKVIAKEVEAAIDQLDLNLIPNDESDSD